MMKKKNTNNKSNDDNSNSKSINNNFFTLKVKFHVFSVFIFVCASSRFIYLLDDISLFVNNSLICIHFDNHLNIFISYFLISYTIFQDSYENCTYERHIFVSLRNITCAVAIILCSVL